MSKFSDGQRTWGNSAASLDATAAVATEQQDDGMLKDQTKNGGDALDAASQLMTVIQQWHLMWNSLWNLTFLNLRMICHQWMKRGGVQSGLAWRPSIHGSIG
jgi:hypothetical protein